MLDAGCWMLGVRCWVFYFEINLLKYKIGT